MKPILLAIAFIFSIFGLQAQNRYDQPNIVDHTYQSTYVPLPLDHIQNALQARQQKYEIAKVKYYQLRKDVSKAMVEFEDDTAIYNTLYRYKEGLIELADKDLSLYNFDEASEQFDEAILEFRRKKKKR
ncbi:MAG: hypothetical protein V4543_12375 [Bacteroidota bacterium]